jgi:hypothetical protein
VTVTTPTGISSTGSGDQFTYNTPSAPTVTAINPTGGLTSGGTVVYVTGTGFTAVSTYSGTSSATPASQYTYT